MATHMRAELVTAALDAAIVHRRPGTDLIHHSDHGTQYTSIAFGRRLRESGIAASMGSAGDCYDNAMAESFFATLETELVDRCDWASPADAKAAVFEYIEVFYNRIRRHSSLGEPQSRAVRGALSFESGRQGRVTHHRPRNRGNSRFMGTRFHANRTGAPRPERNDAGGSGTRTVAPCPASNHPLSSSSRVGVIRTSSTPSDLDAVEQGASEDKPPGAPIRSRFAWYPSLTRQLSLRLRASASTASRAQAFQSGSFEPRVRCVASGGSPGAISAQ
jgi:putative transposase